MLGNLHNRPMLGRIGPWVLASYGPAMAITFFAGFAATASLDAYTGQDPLIKFHYYLFVTFPMILLGARTASILLEWRELRTKPLQTLFKPGYMLQGGIFGAVASLMIYSWWTGANFWLLLDTAAFAMPLGEALGRVGCHLYGCCWGRKKASGWRVTYSHESAKVCRCRPELRNEGLHPAPLYATLSYGALFFVFLWMVPRLEHAGVLAAVYLIVHPIARVILERFRDDDRGHLPGGVTHSNAYSGIMFAGGLLAIAALAMGQTGPFRLGGVSMSMSQSLVEVLSNTQLLWMLAAVAAGAFVAFGVHYKTIGAWLGSHGPSSRKSGCPHHG